MTQNHVILVEMAIKGHIYPCCSEHMAMNKVSPYGMWRCLECHIGYDEGTKQELKNSSEGFKKK